jgi:hypothetical protein
LPLQQDQRFIVEPDSAPTQKESDMTDFKSIEDRLSTIERELAFQRTLALRYRRFCAALVLLIAAGASLAATSAGSIAEVLQTRRLEVLDASGKLVFAASAGASGGQMDLWNAAGRNVMRASVNPSGGDLAIWNTAGTNVYGAFATATGGESALWTADGNRRVRSTGDDRGGRLEIYGSSGNMSLAMTGADTGGSVEVVNGQGGLVAKLASESGGGVARFFSGQSTEILAAGANTNGNGGVLHVANSQGDAVVTASAEGGGCGQFEVFNAQGNVDCSLIAVKDLGGSIALNSSTGKRTFAAASRPQGGLLNVMNSAGIPVVIIGYAEDNRGGAVSIKNGRGVQVLTAGTGENESGTLSVFDADGRKPRTLKP